MKLTPILKICLLLALTFSVLTGCGTTDSMDTEIDSSPSYSNNDTANFPKTSTGSATAAPSVSTEKSFTNAYGTSTTICAHSGCNNYIASSGDTNCCVSHSNKCLNCGKYIDGDAIYCMSCIEDALETDTSSSSSSKSSVYSSSSSSSGYTGAGGYDMPNEDDESFSDYVKRVDPELYASLFQ